MDSPIPSYEVRCPRCDVSFPVGTRKCIHCGGPTGTVDQAVTLESLLHPSTAPVDEYADPEFEVPGQEERELEVSDEPSSIGRSLIRSLGGFVWVIVLIGFTLARNCGGE